MNHAVILAGGGGTRLWPASRRRRPKQLLALGADARETLLHATWRRAAGIVGDRVWIVTAADQADGVAAALPELSRDHILAEPVPRNTAAAVGLAAAFIGARDPDAVLAILPADHHVGDEPGHAATVARALAVAAESGAIVTIGIRPTRPETGFGWLEPGAVAAGGRAREVLRFVEKPDRAAAERYLAGGFLWNGGMFFFRAARMLAEIADQLPALAAGLDALRAAGFSAEATARVYPGLPSISIDHGVMERAGGVLLVDGDFGWSDVGSWAALGETRPADGAGNVVAGRAVLVDARDNVVSTDDDGSLVALVGVSGLVVVRAGNAVLVLPRERAQDVREIVKRLEQGDGDAYL
jgi:mannose-1-phosphate guanylyltransferase